MHHGYKGEAYIGCNVSHVANNIDSTRGYEEWQLKGPWTIGKVGDSYPYPSKGDSMHSLQWTRRGGRRWINTCQQGQNQRWQFGINQDKDSSFLREEWSGGILEVGKKGWKGARVP